MCSITRVLVFVLAAIGAAVPATAQQGPKLTDAPTPAQQEAQETFAIGVEAYLYFYPLVTMDITRRQLTNMEPGKESGRSGLGYGRRDELSLDKRRTLVQNLTLVKAGHAGVNGVSSPSLLPRLCARQSRKRVVAADGLQAFERLACGRAPRVAGGPCNLTVRNYWPTETVLDGTYKGSPVKKLQ